jgi:hypothetical protein
MWIVILQGTPRCNIDIVAFRGMLAVCVRPSESLACCGTVRRLTMFVLWRGGVGGIVTSSQTNRNEIMKKEY